MCAFLAQSYAELFATLLEMSQTGTGPINEDVVPSCLFLLGRLILHCQKILDDPEPSKDGLHYSLPPG